MQKNYQKGVIWSREPILGTVKTRVDGSRYLECSDGKEREVGLQAPPPDEDHLRELLNQCALARGEPSTLEGWNATFDGETPNLTL